MRADFLSGVLELVGGVGAVVAILVPGYVLLTVLDRERFSPRRSDLHLSVTLAIAGILVHVVLSWWTIVLCDRLAGYWDIHDGLSGQLYFEFVIWAVTTLLLVPAILGSLLRLLLQAEPPGAAWLGLTPAGRTTNALLWAFLGHRGRWVRIYLKSGETYVGMFDSRSLLGTASDPGDLYFDKAWAFNRESRPNEAHVALWVPGSEFKMIEFVGTEGAHET